LGKKKNARSRNWFFPFPTSIIIWLLKMKEKIKKKKKKLKPVRWQVSVATVTGEQMLNLLKYAVFNLKISCYTG